MEEWKDLIGFEGRYQISSYGRVKRIEKYVRKTIEPLILKQCISYGGYYSVQLRIDMKLKTYYTHRLVAINFVEGFFDGCLVNHKDENKLNNIHTNLEFVTKSQNHIHSNRGMGFLSRKFSKKQVLYIRKLSDSGVSLNKIAKQFNENSGTLSNIINRVTYKNI